MLTLDDARGLLDPFREQVFLAPALAGVATWHRFVEREPAMAAPLDETARANVIHCWWRNEVRRALASVAGIREVQALGFFAVAVAANPLVRFKCVSAGTPTNVETGQQTLLARQLYDDDAMAALEIDGIPAPPTLLTCGYSLDAVALLRSIEIRCDYRKRLLWRWPIWGDEAESGGVVEQLPLPDMPGPQPAHVRSIREHNPEGQLGAE